MLIANAFQNTKGFYWEKLNKPMNKPKLHYQIHMKWKWKYIEVQSNKVKSKYL